MVRKQLYIDSKQDRALKRLARQTGMTEAASVRRALDAEVERFKSDEARLKAWQETREFIREWMKKGPGSGGRRGRREDLYGRGRLAWHPRPGVCLRSREPLEAAARG